MESITTHLPTLETTPPYPLATTINSFIVAAATGTLNKGLLSLWLYQDRIYAAHAYPRFIGSLIARLPFGEPASMSGFKEEQLQRIFKTLIFCLENIVREVEFFDATAKKYNLNLNGWKERKGTRDYTAEMERISTSGKIEEGLLFLWAMEKVYLEAWSHVDFKLASHPHAGTKEIPAIQSFAKNWSSPEFRKFVDEDLAGLIDEIYRKVGGDGEAAAERMWERVVELEVDFWPKEGEEHSLIQFD